MLGKEKLEELYPDYDKDQYSVNGIDLKVGHLFMSPRGSVGSMAGGKKELPELLNVPKSERNGEKGYYLQPNESYSITADRPMKIPTGYSQLYLSRSTLLRSHVVVNTAVGDSGYEGTLQFQIINIGKEPYFLGENERFVQMVSFKVEGKSENYSGDYQENPDKKSVGRKKKVISEENNKKDSDKGNVEEKKKVNIKTTSKKSVKKNKPEKKTEKKSSKNAKK